MRSSTILCLGLIAGSTVFTSCTHVERADFVTRPVHRRPPSREIRTDGAKPESSARAVAKRIEAPHRVPVGESNGIQSVETGQPNVADDVTLTASANAEADPVQQAAYETDTADEQDGLSVPPAPASEESRGIEIPGEGDDAGSAIGVLTLEDLVQMAVANNPTLQQATAVVHKAQGIRRQVGLHPNPTVGYQGNEIGNDGATGQQGAFFSQLIVTGNKLGLNRAVAEGDVQQLLWELEAQRYRVRNDVQTQFYATLGAQRRLELAEELERIAEEGVAAATELFDAQEVARPDVLQAELQLGEVRIIRQNAEYDLDAEWKKLASLAGRPNMMRTPLAGLLDEAGSGWEWQESYDQLLAASPELQAAYARIDRARAQIRRQQAQPIPNINTQVALAQDNATDDTIASIQFGMPLPVLNNNQGNIALAYAEYRRALRDSERLQLALRIRLTDAFRDYQQAEKQVERYQEDILPKARQNLDLTNDGYIQQEFDFLRVLTARRTYFEANLANVRSLVALRQSEVAISGLVLSGGLNDVPDISQGVGGVGNRGQALSGQ